MLGIGALWPIWILVLQPRELALFSFVIMCWINFQTRSFRLPLMGVKGRRLCLIWLGRTRRFRFMDLWSLRKMCKGCMWVKESWLILRLRRWWRSFVKIINWSIKFSSMRPLQLEVGECLEQEVYLVEVLEQRDWWLRNQFSKNLFPKKLFLKRSLPLKNLLLKKQQNERLQQKNQGQDMKQFICLIQSMIKMAMILKSEIIFFKQSISRK